MSKSAQKQREDYLKIIKGVLEDECPPGYDAHRDPLADSYSLADSVNKLGLALRNAVALLEEV